VWVSLNSTLGIVVFALWCFRSHLAGRSVMPRRGALIGALYGEQSMSALICRRFVFHRARRETCRPGMGRRAPLFMRAESGVLYPGRLQNFRVYNNAM
jgi:hypothetical protein